MGLWIPLIIIVAVVGYGIMAYNRLVALRERFKNAFAQIDVQLKRRYDLIPNLVETAKGYMGHEKETLEAVIRARNEAQKVEQVASRNPGDPEAMQKLAGAEQQLGGALSRLFALSEAYPDLKANQNMMQLQEELASTENRIAFARQSFNDAVMTYNTARQTVPTNIIANSFRFEEAEFFEIDRDEERETPRVSFG